MNTFNGLAEWYKQLIARQVAVDFHALEAEQFAAIERRAKDLDAEGKPEAAAKLRELLGNNLMRQLEGPKRGRPRREEG